MLTSGEAVALKGPNGSGKSTLLRVLATLLAPSSGTSTVFGLDPGSAGGREARSGIALLGHQPSLYPSLTLAENLEFVAGLTARPSCSVPRALAAVGLSAAAERRAQVCSQGMLQRAEFARLLISPPRLLLLDEAQAGLDASARALVGKALDDVRERRGAAVLVTHETRLVPVDRVVELDRGRLRPAS